MFSCLSSSSLAVKKCIEDAWRNKELVDITIRVSDTRFQCHSLVLCACSGFFKSLFNDGLIQAQKEVTLKDISAHAFEMILTLLYSGTNIINKDSIVEIWHASHQLEISFLLEECEKYVMSSLSLQNYKDYYCSAKQLECSPVLNAVFDFMARNFNICKDSRVLLHLTGDELLKIIRHKDLKVTTEDYVIGAILEWIDYPLSTEKLEHVHSKFTANDNSTRCEIQQNEITKDEMVKNVSKCYLNVGSENNSSNGNTVGLHLNATVDNVESNVISKNDEIVGSMALNTQPFVEENSKKAQYDINSSENEIETETIEIELERKSAPRQNLIDVNLRENIRIDIGDENNGMAARGMVNSKQRLSYLEFDQEKYLNENVTWDMFRNARKHTIVPNITKTSKHNNKNISDRSKYLVSLLKATKTCLLSPHCLGQLYNNKHILSLTEAKNIIFKSTLYQSGISDHGHWPTCAIHRQQSNMENVGVFIENTGDIHFLSFLSKEWHTIKPTAELKPSNFIHQFTVFKNDLYAVCLVNSGSFVSGASFDFYIFKGQKWLKISETSTSIYKSMNGKTTATAQLDFLKSFSNAIVTCSSSSSKEGTSVNTHLPLSSNSIQAWGNSDTSNENSSKTNCSFSKLKIPSTKSSLTQMLSSTNSNFLISPKNVSESGAKRFATNCSKTHEGITIDTFALNQSTSTCDSAATAQIAINQSLLKPISLISTPASDSLISTPASDSLISTPASDSLISTSESDSLIGRNHTHLISHGSYIYLFYLSHIQRINPNLPDFSIEVIPTFLTNEKIEYVSTFDEFLLVYCSNTTESNKTLVYSFNTNTDKAIKSHILDGPASGLIVFQDDVNKYMLQSNGTLWNITRESDRAINFDILVKLWDLNFKLIGGVFYNGELNLLSHNPTALSFMTPKYPKLFEKIHFYSHVSTCSRFLPYVMSKKVFPKKKVFLGKKR